MKFRQEIQCYFIHVLTFYEKKLFPSDKSGAIYIVIQHFESLHFLQYGNSNFAFVTVTAKNVSISPAEL